MIHRKLTSFAELTRWKSCFYHRQNMFETHRAHTLVPSCQQRANRTTPEKRSWENKIKVNLFPTSFLENSFRFARGVCLLHSVFPVCEGTTMCACLCISMYCVGMCFCCTNAAKMSFCYWYCHFLSCSFRRLTPANVFHIICFLFHYTAVSFSKPDARHIFHACCTTTSIKCKSMRVMKGQKSW